MKWKAAEEQKCFVHRIHPEFQDTEFVQEIRSSHLDLNGSETLYAKAPVVGHHCNRCLIPIPLWRFFHKMPSVALEQFVARF